MQNEAKVKHIGKTIVAVGVTVAMLLTLTPLLTRAESPENGAPEHICGQTEHTHSQEAGCYGRELVCGCEEGAVHTHGEGCYTTETQLVCPQPEGHVHDDACYTQEQRLICTQEHEHGADCYAAVAVLSCAAAENHAHTEACYAEQTSLQCGLTEGAPHVHTEACYGDVLVCQLPEHTHTADCLPAAELTAQLSAEKLTCQPDERVRFSYAVGGGDGPYTVTAYGAQNGERRAIEKVSAAQDYFLAAAWMEGEWRVTVSVTDAAENTVTAWVDLAVTKTPEIPVDPETPEGPETPVDPETPIDPAQTDLTVLITADSSSCFVEEGVGVSCAISGGTAPYTVSAVRTQGEESRAVEDCADQFTALTWMAGAMAIDVTVTDSAGKTAAASVCVEAYARDPEPPAAAEELSVALFVQGAYCFAGSVTGASYQVSGGVAPYEIVTSCTQEGERRSDPAVATPEGAFEAAPWRGGTVTVAVTVTDSAGNADEAAVSLPVPVREGMETAEDWEKTIPAIPGDADWAQALLLVAQSQLGVREVLTNFIVDNGRQRGYSRYGDWYGSPYGDWCAMFVSFCLHYAGVSEEVVPLEAGCEQWVNKLTALGLYFPAEGYIPAPGDIIFFDGGNGRSGHVGIVEGVESEDGVLLKVHTIEGNSYGERVTRRDYGPARSILGYMSMQVAMERYAEIVDG